MSASLEVIMPVRNPSGTLLESIDSLALQTDRNFSVLLSDNGSTRGLEFIEQARAKLEGASIPVRIVRPPFELGRIEHWNWAHGEGRADWLKPLFIGDLLFPVYVESLFARIAEKPEAKFIRCEHEYRCEGAPTITTQAPISASSLTPQNFLRYFPHLGNWIGGPVNVAYHRLAWQLAGGYLPQLPACGDLQLYVTMILRHGVESIATPLAAFQLHPHRFSHQIAGRRVNGLFELWLIFRQMKDQCREEGLEISTGAVRAALWRQFKSNYWHDLKRNLKHRLRSDRWVGGR